VSTGALTFGDAATGAGLGGGGAAGAATDIPFDVGAAGGAGLAAPDAAAGTGFLDTGLLDTAGTAGSGSSGGLSGLLSSLNSFGTENAGLLKLGGLVSSIGGLGLDALRGNSPLPNENALSGIPASLAAALAPTQAALSATATNLPTQLAPIQSELSSIASSLPGQVAPNQTALANEAAGLNTQGQALANYLQTGTLPPGVQQSINSASAAAKAAIRSRYAGMGGDTSAMAQDLANVDNMAVSQGATIATSLLDKGITEQNLASQIYSALVGQSNAVAGTQAGIESTLGQENIASTSAIAAIEGELAQLGISQAGVGANIYNTLLSLAVQQNGQLGSAISTFASALAGQGSGAQKFQLTPTST
jgi:hypothetical protein